MPPRPPSPSSRSAAAARSRSTSTSPRTSRCARSSRARSTTTARSNGLHVNAADMSPEVLGVDGESDLLTIPLSVWQRTLDVNLTGFLLAARATIPHLLEAGGGGITNTVSDAIYAGESVRVGYATTKTRAARRSRVTSRAGGDAKGSAATRSRRGSSPATRRSKPTCVASHRREPRSTACRPSRRHRVDGGVPALGRRRVGERSGVERERRPLPQLRARSRVRAFGERTRLFGVRLQQEARLRPRRGWRRRTAPR